MPRRRPGILHVGIKGHVIALDRATGAELWRTKLEGVRMRVHEFVHLHRDSEHLYAAYSGEVYALDPATGEVRWHSQMRGLGTGLVSLLSDEAGSTDGGGGRSLAAGESGALFEANRQRNQSQHSQGA